MHVILTFYAVHYIKIVLSSEVLLLWKMKGIMNCPL